jgi:hypothetical protein
MLSVGVSVNGSFSVRSYEKNSQTQNFIDDIKLTSKHTQANAYMSDLKVLRQVCRPTHSGW